MFSGKVKFNSLDMKFLLIFVLIIRHIYIMLPILVNLSPLSLHSCIIIVAMYVVSLILLVAYFQNVNTFVKSMLCTRSLPIMLALCSIMVCHPIKLKVMLA